MVHKTQTSLNNSNPCISFIKECIQTNKDFHTGKIILSNETIEFNKSTDVKIINNEYLRLKNLAEYKKACIKISDIIGVIQE